MSKKQFSIAVVIGRFNLPHNGHFYLFRKALEMADNLIVVIGSANNPRTPKDPFTESDRASMIKEGLLPEECSRVNFTYVEDELYNDSIWAAKVQFAVQEASGKITGNVDPEVSDKSTCLVGFHKDDSSFYLNMFPQWSRVDVDPYKCSENNVLSSTTLRNDLFSYKFDDFKSKTKTLIPTEIIDYLAKNVIEQSWFNQLIREKNFLDQYRKQFESYAYPPVFVTADTVVMQSGHVLMVTRKSEPGKGLLALPGGFVNQSERLKAAALRELVEETRIKVPMKILEKSIKGMKEFDHPNRSSRGRTITFAYLIQLEDVGSLPKVKGEDDAAEATWYPISQILRGRYHIFEDHLDIIRHFLGYL